MLNWQNSCTFSPSLRRNDASCRDEFLAIDFLSGKSMHGRKEGSKFRDFIPILDTFLPWRTSSLRISQDSMKKVFTR